MKYGDIIPEAPCRILLEKDVDEKVKELRELIVAYGKGEHGVIMVTPERLLKDIKGLFGVDE